MFGYYLIVFLCQYKIMRRSEKVILTTKAGNWKNTKETTEDTEYTEKE